MLTYAASTERALELDLSPRDLDDLYRSGIGDVAIVESRIYTEWDGLHLCRLLNRPSSPPNLALAPAMVIPLCGPDGAFPIVRAKPHVAQGEGRKYIQPTGERNRAYFSSAALAAFKPGGERKILILVGGEKKAICLSQHGWPAIALTGVWNWKYRPDKKRDESFLLPELADAMREIIGPCDGPPSKRIEAAAAMEQSAYEYLKGECSVVTSKAIGEKLGKSERRARKLLASLERKRYLQRVGERGGWTLAYEHYCSEPTSSDYRSNTYMDIASSAATIGPGAPDAPVSRMRHESRP
jgi:hypothetical protein